MSSYRLISIASLLLPFVAFTQEMPKSVHVVRASAEASVRAKPDQARISIAVNTQAPTAQQAASQNATATSQVITTLKRAIGDRGEVTTSGYGIVPTYQTQKNGPPKVNGYQANETVSATVNDLALLGKVIDLATQSGANQMYGFSFTLRNDEDVRAQALAEAAKKARSNAEAIAKALGLQVVGILQAQSGEGEPPPPLPAVAQSAMTAEISETPIQAGTLDIHATVTVTLEVR